MCRDQEGCAVLANRLALSETIGTAPMVIGRVVVLAVRGMVQAPYHCIQRCQMQRAHITPR
jgi:hypothetical protein